MKRTLRHILAMATLLLMLGIGAERASAQHTLSVTGGAWGASFARFYPAEEAPMTWDSENFGLSWRYYSERPRFVGAIGFDLEYLERGYKFGYQVDRIERDEEGNEIARYYDFYERKVNSIMLPFIWQPHVYLAKNSLRIYIEAAFVLSYNISSRYDYLDGAYPAGKYEWKVPRDNRFGYGLAAGAGFTVLLGQVEFGVRARYNFGYSDILKNRNKYYSNSTDGPENPFYYSPLRSPMDNINISLVVGWRFNKQGFNEWKVVKPKKEKRAKGFNYSGAVNSSGAQGTQGAMGGRGTSGARGGSSTMRR